MAGSIAVDAYVQGPQSTATSWTWSHTCTGLNRILIVVQHQSDTITGVTYAGVAMTLGKAQSSGSTGLKIWYLINPASGANNIVASSSSNTYIRHSSISFTGAHQTIQPDATGGNTAAGTGITASITNIINNSWNVGLIVGSNDADTWTPISGVTKIGDVGGDGQSGVFRSTTEVQAGSNGIGVTGGGSTTWTAAALGIRPLDVPGGGSPIFFGNTAIA